MNLRPLLQLHTYASVHAALYLYSQLQFPKHYLSCLFPLQGLLPTSSCWRTQPSILIQGHLFLNSPFPNYCSISFCDSDLWSYNCDNHCCLK